MPIDCEHLPMNCENTQLEEKFKYFAAEHRMFILVFCEDNRFKGDIIGLAEKNKKQLIYQACAYFTPGDLKNEDDLSEKIVELLDGNEMGESSEESEDEDDYLEILAPPEDKRPLQKILFNPPNNECIREICTRWNYARGVLLALINLLEK